MRQPLRLRSFWRWRTAPAARRERGAAGRRRSRPYRFESLEARNLLAGVPFGATSQDTAEFLLGDVHVNVVFLESTGEIDPSTEDWTPQQIEDVKQNVVEGITWWSDLLAAQDSVHELNFHFDFTFADAPFATVYEPISRVSQDYKLWVYEFLDHTGFGNLGLGDVGLSRGIRAFNHAERVESNSNWGFTIFVVNSENDADGRFPSGSDFGRAFAFAGGRFFVSPSTRPASTYAHEMGHIFYAMDEHGGGFSYTARRGYYNTQNLNAFRDHPDPESRVTSIMDQHEPAYPINAISTSAMEMVGWRDSDGDGIFDVLDVPLSLTGSGAVDPATGMYRFVGQASVGSLRNLNAFSLQSDITINQVSRVQYRIDGGAWFDAVAPHAYSAELDFSFHIPEGLHDIEIRALDDATNEAGEAGVVSPTFHGTTAAPAATPLPGINGFLWNDQDGDGVRDVGEPSLAGWTIEVRGPSGQPLNLEQRIEPDDYQDESDIAQVHPDVKLSASGTGVASPLASVRTGGSASTGSKVFAHQALTGSQPTWSTEWTGSQRQLLMEFAEPVTTISIDAVANSDGDMGRLEIYDQNFQLIERVSTAPLAAGQAATMTLGRPKADIKYAIATGHGESSVRLDNLRFGPETTATTDANGAWSVPHLDSGSFTVRVIAPPAWQATSPGGASQPVTLNSGAAVENISFGFHNAGSAWHNQPSPADVNGDGLVTTQDLLDVVQHLRNHGLGVLEGEPEEGGSLIDADGDGVAGPNDLLVVITQLRAQIQQQGEGEGETGLLSEGAGDAFSGPTADSPAEAEAEDPAAAPERLWPPAFQITPPRDEPGRLDGSTRPQDEPPRTPISINASERLGDEDPGHAVGRSRADRLASTPWSEALDDDAFDTLINVLALDIAETRLS